MEEFVIEEFGREKITIYKVPALLKDRHPHAYTPRLVSIGPFHHRATHLQPMERHKDRAVKQFTMRSNLNYKNCFDAIRPVICDIMDSYQGSYIQHSYDTDYYVRMMVNDGCFLLEFMRGYFSGGDYGPEDPVFGSNAARKLSYVIAQDIMMLENQLPLVVLDRLIALEQDCLSEKNHKKACEFVFNFLAYWIEPGHYSSLKAAHMLDISREIWTSKIYIDLHDKHIMHNSVTRSASELVDAGVRFRVSEVSEHVGFSKGTLFLPPLKFSSSTHEVVLLNAIAFEMLHLTAIAGVSSYLNLMHKLIQSPADVRVLRNHGLLNTGLTMNNEDVLASIRRIADGYELRIDPHCDLSLIYHLMDEYYTRKMNSMFRVKNLLRCWKRMQ